MKDGPHDLGFWVIVVDAKSHFFVPAIIHIGFSSTYEINFIVFLLHPTILLDVKLLVKCFLK